jgi:hypothetical protein
MSTNPQVLKKTQDPTAKALENYGSIFGFFLGAIAGVLLAGPNFQVWTPLESILTILGGGITLGLIGHFAFALFFGTAAAGNADEYAAQSTDEAISLNEMGD